MFGLFNKRGIKGYWKEVIGLYDDLLYTNETKNNSAYAIRKPSESGRVAVDFSGMYDGERITVFYLIESLPKELMISYRERIRRECSKGVRVNFLNYMRRHVIDWESSAMRSRLRVLEQMSNDNGDKNVNAYNLHKNISSMTRQSWIEESLTYLSVADRQRGRALVKTSTLMSVSGVMGEEYDMTLASIESTCRTLGIKLERILFDIPDVLSYFSPFKRPSIQVQQKVGQRVTTQVMTDELAARFNSYTQGTHGKRGISFGIDVFSGFPVLKTVKPKIDTAENWLYTAETGGGKSNGLKEKLLQLIGLGFNGTIMDIEGFEYLPLAKYTSHNSKVVVINMAEGSGNYFDPVEIPEPTGYEDIDSEAKNLSINFTISIFKTLSGRVYFEDTWVDTVINDAVSEVYKAAGVVDDPKTWGKSEGLTLFDVYKRLNHFKEVGFRDDKGYTSALEKVIAVTGKYFEPDGTRASIFKNRISIKNIIDADLVVCSFGMAGKSPQTIDETQLALMQIGAAQVSHQRSIFSKCQGKFNFKVWEEFQRWGKFPDSDKVLGVAITGGRKLGDVNIIVTNSVGQILEDDRFDIVPNITSFMIGAISDEKVRDELLARLSVRHLKPELDAISKAKKDTDDEDGESREHPLQYAFLCGLDRSKYTIVKTKLPRDLQESILFRTGVEKVEKQDISGIEDTEDEGTINFSEQSTLDTAHNSSD